MRVVAVTTWHKPKLAGLIDYLVGSDADGMLARSTRADTEHLTDAVRVLDASDARRLGINPDTWVRFVEIRNPELTGIPAELCGE